MPERFARVCPVHHQVLDELADGQLVCRRVPHRVVAWVVVDLERREVLGAGRALRRDLGVSPGVWLGARLQLTAQLLLELDVEPHRCSLPVSRRPPAAA